MAERKYNVDINLLGNQLLNGVIHVATSHPTVPAPKAGQIYYNSTDKTIYLYDGTTWKALFTTKASETVLGLVELATSTQATDGTDTESSNPLVVKPSQLKAGIDSVKAVATTTSKGMTELATLAQVYTGTDTEGGNPLVVQPSHVLALFDDMSNLNVGGDLSGSLPNPVVEQSTSADGFLLKIGSYEVRLIPVNTSTLAVKNSGGSAYANLETLDMHVKGNLTVDGVVKQVSTEQIQLEDSILVLNSNETSATPTQNAGLEVERGTVLNNTQLIWNESTDRWEINDGTNQFAISLKKVVTITGDATTVNFDVTHYFNTKDVIVQVFNSSNVQEECGIDTNYLNKVIVSFNTAPANGVTYKVVING